MVKLIGCYSIIFYQSADGTVFRQCVLNKVEIETL